MIIEKKNNLHTLEIADKLDVDNELEIVLVYLHDNFSFWINQEDIEKVINHLSKFVKEKEKD